ncbi:MAG: hypothetical protein WC757_00620 [Candidatus Paceibacterota bacterium]|jgi:hypothetical protein
MADDKKPKGGDKGKKPAEAVAPTGFGGTSLTLEEAILFAIVIVVIFVAVGGTMFFKSFSISPHFFSNLFYGFLNYSVAFGLSVLDWFSIVSFGLTFSLSVLIAIVFFKTDKIGHAEHEKYYPTDSNNSLIEMTSKTVKNQKWENILLHVSSDKQNDWKIAILEADIMLGDMLERMGYRGEGIGDMLKSIEKSDFTTLDSAWEAHKIRNMIAHEGQDFILTEREARRVIELYKAVFNEFKLI